MISVGPPLDIFALCIWEIQLVSGRRRNLGQEQPPHASGRVIRPVQWTTSSFNMTYRAKALKADFGLLRGNPHFKRRQAKAHIKLRVYSACRRLVLQCLGGSCVAAGIM